MNQRSEHLSDAQIEQYGKRASGAGPETEARVETHLDDCPSCRSRVLEFQRTQFALLPDPKVITVSSSSCPSEQDLRNLAAGLCSGPLAAELTAHAAACGRCGPLLREYQEDFSDDVTPEEQTALAQLRSASPEWQRKKAREMLKQVRTTVPRPSPRWTFTWRWALIPAAVAACAAIAVSIWYTQRDTPEKVEALLAQAYTEQRPMELRWPGAAWGPVRTTRGPEDSRFAKPPALLKAEGKISERASAKANEVEWLQAKAQADILERNPEAAIVSLSQALETRPGSVSLMLDLSTAYYQQGEISLDPQNYEKSVDLLGQVLQKDPDNLTALFNRALLNEQMKMVDSAIADWELFLKKERDPAWADDARKRLSALQELKRKKSSYSPPVTVEQWTTALTSDNPTAAEEALDAAVIEWLPKAYPAHPSPDRSESEYARLLVLAAKKLQSQHHDSWLADLLRVTGSAHFAQGISELKAAALLNSQGKASAALVSAGKAQAAFGRDRNFPGLARAELEEIYAFQRSGKGSPCLERAAKSRSGVENRAYSWLKTQLLLDEASCFNIQGRLEEAKLDAEDALAQNGVAAGYKILQLRVLGIAAALATTRGDRAFAVKQDLAGLQEYWAGQYPIIRAYQFCSDLSFNTEAAGLWQLTYAADKEAVWAISQTPNKQVEAVARYRLAKAAVMLGERQVAETEMQQADRIFAQLPKAESTLIAQIDGIAGVIRAHINLGLYDVAYNQLQQINVPSELTESRLIARRMDQIKGDVELKLGNLKEAEEAYLAAVTIAEASLGTLRDDHARLIWADENEVSYRALASVKLKQGASTEALSVMELYKAAPLHTKSFGSTLGVRAPQNFHLAVNDLNHLGIVSRVLTKLGPETVVVYAFLSEGLVIWVLDNSGVSFRRANMGPAQIGQLARQFTEECSDPSSDHDNLQRHGKELYRTLIEPIRKYLKPGRRVVFETDGDLDSLPFESLISSTAQYLGEELTVSFSPGLAFSPAMTNIAIKPSTNALVVGEPLISAKWSRTLPGLPSARKEGLAVASQFRHSQLLMGRDATRSRILSLLQNAEIFHFAGHEIETKTGAALVLAEDPGRGSDNDLMAAGDVSPQHFRALKLVVLSACASRSKRNGARFSEAFHLWGAKQVMTTRWAVDSTATEHFITFFYASLASGKSAPEALKAAARQLRSQTKTVHPYYWAAFSIS